MTSLPALPSESANSTIVPVAAAPAATEAPKKKGGRVGRKAVPGGATKTDKKAGGRGTGSSRRRSEDDPSAGFSLPAVKRMHNKSETCLSSKAYKFLRQLNYKWVQELATLAKEHTHKDTRCTQMPRDVKFSLSQLEPTSKLLDTTGMSEASKVKGWVRKVKKGKRAKSAAGEKQAKDVAVVPVAPVATPAVAVDA
jgi:histone H3/H4